MKHSILTFLVLLVSLTTYSQNAAIWKWAKTDTTAELNINQAFLKEIVGVKNNKILHGYLKNSKITPYQATAYGDYNISEYDTAGTVHATRTVNGTVSLKDIQGDNLGNWYVFATVHDSIDFGGGNVYKTDIWSEGIYYIFKLHAGTLALDWCKKISATPLTRGNCFTLHGDQLYVVTDSAYACRIYRMSTSDGSYALFITQLGNGKISSVQVDNNENLYVAGYCPNPYMNGICFNGTTSIPTGNSEVQTYIVRYKRNGMHDWHIWMPDNMSCARKLTLATNNLIYYSGAVHDSMTLGGFHIKRPYVYSNFLLARLDSAGSVAWIKEAKDSTIGNVNMEHTCNAAINIDSSITIFSNIQGNVNWGNGVTSTAPMSTQSATCTHFASDGTVLWAKEIAGHEVYAQQIASNNTDVFVAGIARDSFAIQFDGISLSQTSLYSPYVARLATGAKTYNNGGPHGAPTSVSSTSDNFIVNTSPNPATNSITISGMANTHDPIWISFVDMSGKVVYERTLSMGTAIQQIDISEYARGLYVLQVRSGQLQYAARVLLQ